MIRDSEIINLGLKQLSQDHLLLLQEATLTGKDRLAIAHENYQKTHGKITLDQFIAKLVPCDIKS